MANLIKINIISYRALSDVSMDFTTNSIKTILGNNGKGKSSTIGALFWAITGKTDNGETAQNIINGKQAHVIVEFQVSRETATQYGFTTTALLIERKHNSLTVNNGEFAYENKRDLQSILDEILGSYKDLRTFCCIQQNGYKLLKSGAADINNFFYSMFDFTICDRIVADVSKKYTDYTAKQSNDSKALEQLIFESELVRQKLNNTISLIKEKEEKIQILEGNTFDLSKIQEFNDALQAQKLIADGLSVEITQDKTTLADLNAELVNLSSKVTDATKYTQTKSIELSRAETLLRKTKEFISTSQKMADNLKKEIEGFNTSIHQKVCHICNSDLTDFTHITEVLDANKDKYSALLDSMANINLDKYQADLDEALELFDHSKDVLDVCKAAFEEKKVEINNYSNKIHRVQTLLESTQARIKSLDNDIKSLENAPKNNKDKIDIIKIEIDIAKTNILQGEDKLSNIQSQIGQLHEELKPNLDLENLYTVICKRDELRTYVLNSYLDALNQQLASYSFGGTVLQILKDKRSYLFQVKKQNSDTLYPTNALSGGEFRRVELSLVLALNTLFSKVDFMALDEVDTALDVSGVEDLIDFVEFLNNELHKKIIMITHNQNFYIGSSEQINL